eukprot:3029186-Rhodomonas_salina.3
MDGSQSLGARYARSDVRYHDPPGQHQAGVASTRIGSIADLLALFQVFDHTFFLLSARSPFSSRLIQRRMGTRSHQSARPRDTTLLNLKQRVSEGAHRMQQPLKALPALNFRYRNNSGNVNPRLEEEADPFFFLCFR